MDTSCAVIVEFQCYFAFSCRASRPWDVGLISFLSADSPRILRLKKKNCSLSRRNGHELERVNESSFSTRFRTTVCSYIVTLIFLFPYLQNDGLLSPPFLSPAQRSFVLFTNELDKPARSRRSNYFNDTRGFANLQLPRNILAFRLVRVEIFESVSRSWKLSKHRRKLHRKCFKKSGMLIPERVSKFIAITKKSITFPQFAKSPYRYRTFLRIIINPRYKHCSRLQQLRLRL